MAMPVIVVKHKATTVNLSILSFIVLYLFFYYTLLSDWIALVFPRLGLKFYAFVLTFKSDH